jgi:hypothetical protein
MGYYYNLTIRDKWSPATLLSASGSYAALVGIVVDYCFKRPGGFTWTLVRREDKCG